MAFLALAGSMLGGAPAKTRELPSGDHIGSISLTSLGTVGICSGGSPPSDGTTKASIGLPGSPPLNAILLPSGDQRGNMTLMGGNVNCNGSLPSRRLLQRVPCG